MVTCDCYPELEAVITGCAQCFHELTEAVNKVNGDDDDDEEEELEDEDEDDRFVNSCQPSAVFSKAVFHDCCLPFEVARPRGPRPRSPIVYYEVNTNNLLYLTRFDPQHCMKSYMCHYT